MMSHVYRILAALVLLLIDVQILDNARESSVLAIVCIVGIVSLVCWIAWEIFELTGKLFPWGGE